MIHPSTEVRYIGEHVGWGVFATQKIPTGTITYVWDPLEIEVGPADPRLDDPVTANMIERYSYIDPGGTRIVSWDHAKYVNHSCQCNTMSTAYGFEVAVRDIDAGEEISDEYGMFNLTEPMDCRCASEACRTRIEAIDLELFHERWDSQVQAALRSALDVVQPLWHLVDSPTARAITRLVRWNKGYRSVRELRAEPTGPATRPVPPAGRAQVRAR